MRYLVMEFETNGDINVEEWNTKEDAIASASDMWSKMTTFDKKRANSFFVLDSVNPDEDAEDHFDGDIIKEFK